MDSNNFYNTRKWRKKRIVILKRDNFLCRRCARYGKEVDATTVHHIMPLEFFPELALVNDNLMSLCEKCHNKMHPEKGKKKNSPPT